MLYQRSLDIERRLQMVLRLIRTGNVSTPMIAEQLGVSIPTVSRDVTALRERGYDIRSERKGEGWRFVLAPEPSTHTPVSAYRVGRSELMIMLHLYNPLLGRGDAHMNANILKRVVRAIADGSQSDLDRLAEKMVEAERRTGHTKLADQLEAILKQPRPRGNSHAPTIAGDQNLKELPLSRRHGESLATLFATESLEHHMVLPAVAEERFARIECEFAARDRLGLYGLRPRKTILLYGPPGCGKSLGAKRLAWKTGLPLMKVRFDALISSYFGESAANLRAIFIAAKERPCVLLLDECDFIARSRNNSKDIGEASRIVNSLLATNGGLRRAGLTRRDHERRVIARYRAFPPI